MGNNTFKPGSTTSEFKLVVGSIAFLWSFPGVSPNVAAIITGVVISVYILGRTWAKARGADGDLFGSVVDGELQVARVPERGAEPGAPLPDIGAPPAKPAPAEQERHGGPSLLTGAVVLLGAMLLVPACAGVRAWLDAPFGVPAGSGLVLEVQSPVLPPEVVPGTDDGEAPGGEPAGPDQDAPGGPVAGPVDADGQPGVEPAPVVPGAAQGPGDGSGLPLGAAASPAGVHAPEQTGAVPSWPGFDGPAPLLDIPLPGGAGSLQYQPPAPGPQDGPPTNGEVLVVSPVSQALGWVLGIPILSYLLPELYRGIRRRRGPAVTQAPARRAVPAQAR